MSRIQPLPRNQFGPSARITDLVVRRMVGRSFEGVGIVARVPALLRASGGMERAFLGRRKTPHRLLELVALRTAMEVGCSFCIDVGSYMAQRKHDVTEAQIRGLVDHAGSGAFTPSEVAALDLAVAMTATPPTVDDALWSRLAEHFDDAQLVELTAMIGWENSRARMNAAFGVESHGFSDGMACATGTLAPDAAATTSA